MRFELFIAGRYLLARRRQAFISVISLISTLGVTVGVMALIIALALMTGLQRELRDRILGSTAHIYVFKAGGITDYTADVARITAVPGVVGAAPSTTEKGLMSSRESDGVAEVNIKGIDPVLESGVTEIAGGMKSGSLDALAQLHDGLPGVLLGTNLAQQYGINLGDEVDFLTAHSTRMTPGGISVRPRRAPWLRRRSACAPAWHPLAGAGRGGSASAEIVPAGSGGIGADGIVPVAGATAGIPVFRGRIAARVITGRVDRRSTPLPCALPSWRWRCRYIAVRRFACRCAGRQQQAANNQCRT